MAVQAHYARGSSCHVKYKWKCRVSFSTLFRQYCRQMCITRVRGARTSLSRWDTWIAHCLPRLHCLFERISRNLVSCEFKKSVYIEERRSSEEALVQCSTQLLTQMHFQESALGFLVHSEAWTLVILHKVGSTIEARRYEVAFKPTDFQDNKPFNVSALREMVTWVYRVVELRCRDVAVIRKVPEDQTRYDSESAPPNFVHFGTDLGPVFISLVTSVSVSVLPSVLMVVTKWCLIL